MELKEKIIQAIDKAVDEHQTIGSEEIANEVMEVIEQENQIKFAEQQLLGYAMAGNCNVSEVIESMGLTKDEWATLKNTFGAKRLSSSDFNDIETYFKD